MEPSSTLAMYERTIALSTRTSTPLGARFPEGIKVRSRPLGAYPEHVNSPAAARAQVRQERSSPKRPHASLHNAVQDLANATLAGHGRASHNGVESAGYWRKEWDSNPRRACAHGGFQDRCLKPLGHPSAKKSRLVSIYAAPRGNSLIALIPPQRPGENDISSLAIVLWSACPSKGTIGWASDR